MLLSLSLVRDGVRIKVTHLPIPESCYSSIPKLHMWSELQLLLEDKWHPVPLNFLSLDITDIRNNLYSDF